LPNGLRLLLINARSKNDLSDLGWPGGQAIVAFNGLDRVDLRTSAKATQQAAVSAEFQ
jgi:hypothetical protein